MTYVFLVFTAIISIWAFNNQDVFTKLMLNPYQVYNHKEYYRVFSHGFIHSDWMHLIVNMFVLYSFGTALEQIFDSLASEGLMQFPHLWYTGLYLIGIILSSSTTIYKHRNNSLYNCVGASGAVSAVLFCTIFFAPMQKLGIYFVIPMPGIIFGILYLGYSQYMSRKNIDNINHDAHFLGALFGFLFPLIINYHWFYDIFIYQLFNH